MTQEKHDATLMRPPASVSSPLCSSSAPPPSTAYDGNNLRWEDENRTKKRQWPPLSYPPNATNRYIQLTIMENGMRRSKDDVRVCVVFVFAFFRRPAPPPHTQTQRKPGTPANGRMAIRLSKHDPLLVFLILSSNEALLCGNARAMVPSLGRSSGVIAFGPSTVVAAGGQTLTLNPSSHSDRSGARPRDNSATSSAGPSGVTLRRCCLAPTPASRRVPGADLMTPWTPLIPTPRNCIKQDPCHEALASFTSWTYCAKRVAWKSAIKPRPSEEKHMTSAISQPRRHMSTFPPTYTLSASIEPTPVACTNV